MALQGGLSKLAVHLGFQGEPSGLEVGRPGGLPWIWGLWEMSLPPAEQACCLSRLSCLCLCLQRE